MRQQLIKALLRDGVPVRFKATGLSMAPSIASGDIVEVTPIAAHEAELGDIVVYEQGECVRVHRVIEVKPEPDSKTQGPHSRTLLCRGDNLPSTDPPVQGQQVLGRVTSVYPGPRGLAAVWEWSIRLCKGALQRYRISLFS